MAELKETLVNGDLTVTGSVLIQQNLTVQGTASYIETQDLKVKDKLIEIASGSTTLDALNGSGIQLGASNLNVFLSYSRALNKLVIRPDIDGNITSASHAAEVAWPGVTQKPNFPSLSFAAGPFEASSPYYPTGSEKGYSVKIPKLSSHVGAVDTGSYNAFSSSVSTKLETLATTASINEHITASNVRFKGIEDTTKSLNDYTSSNDTWKSSVERSTSSLNTFTSSAAGRLNSLESTSGSLLINKLDKDDFRAWTGSNTSTFAGTASRATTASWSDGAAWSSITDRPKVNNGVLTIKQGGVSQGTFSANQEGDSTISLADTNTHYTAALSIQGAGTEAVKYTQDSEKSLNIKGSGATTVSKTAAGEITVSSTDTNTWRPLGTGATDACAGNDSRLSDSRTPKSHNHAGSDITSSVASASYAASADKATTATKLTSTSGSATQPVYINNGVPTACTSYANASVNYAGSAGSATNADKLDGYHYNDLVPVTVSAVTSGTITLSPNKTMNCGTLTGAVVFVLGPALDNNRVSEYHATFTTGNTVQVTIPAVTWSIGKPSIRANHSYEMSIQNGFGILIEY